MIVWLYRCHDYETTMSVSKCTHTQTLGKFNFRKCTPSKPQVSYLSKGNIVIAQNKFQILFDYIPPTTQISVYSFHFNSSK